MTNERAIELLHRLQDEQFDGVHGDERREALEMAVRALFSQQIVNDSQGLVKDCISRKMAIEAFEPEHHTDWYTPTIIKTLEELPPAQPERKKGKWIRHDEIRNVYGGICIECSECGEKYIVQHIEDEKYCRNCGADCDADMRGESDETG